MSVRKIQLAVFDIAGTTVKDEDFVAEAFIGAFEDAGIAINIQHVNPLMGFRKIDAITTLLDQMGVDRGDGFPAYVHELFERRMISFYATSEEVVPLPHAEELFGRLRSAGVYVALNSGFPRVVVDAILERLGWQASGMIDFSIASDEVPVGRPYPFMIQKIMQAAGVSDSEYVMKVGDTTVDIEEGRLAGCGLVVAVTTGAQSREELLRASPDRIIDGLNELFDSI